MRCLYCKEIIDDDSFYCDQCGQKLSFCPDCKVLQRGTECPICGATLVGGKEYFSQAGISPATIATTTVRTADITVDAKPWYLAGEGMKLELKAGPFGRTSGIYAEFSSCIFVSGRHGEFARTSQGWTVMDYGSTNGTYLNGIRLKPNTPYPIKKGDTLKISRLSFVIQ